MLEIFRDYWQFFVGGAFFIFACIVALIRKRPISDIFSCIYDYVIYAINRFECPGNGEKKKELVMNFVKQSLLNVFPNLDVDKYDSLISKTIEKVLTTPQKKGG